jgi:hypothetical protein
MFLISKEKFLYAKFTLNDLNIIPPKINQNIVNDTPTKLGKVTLESVER